MSATDESAISTTIVGVYKGDATKLSPALYVAIRDPAKGTFVKAYGEAAPGRPATIADSFRIGSVSKAFTATVVLQLVADGKLSLTTKVAEVLPELAAKYPPIAALDVLCLLNMSSGLADFMNTKTGAVPMVVASPNKAWTCEELLAVGLAQGVQPVGKTG
jgi:D-alanyl-D-alanine carboxypeptidase